jgi:hypothetical protein
MDTFIKSDTNTDTNMDNITNELKGIKEQLQGLIEINARFAQEIIALKQGTVAGNGFNGTSTIATSSTKKPKISGVLLTCGTEKIKVSGNTYDHRGIFFENGGSWNKAEKVWEVPIDSKDSIVDELKAKEIEVTVN